MRFQVWGLKKSQLLMSALLPLICWLIFRWQDQTDLSVRSFLHFYRFTLIEVGIVYAFFIGAWLYFLKRGLFNFRQGFYLAVVLEFTYEIVQAVSSRNLARIGLWMLLFVLLGAAYRWLEMKIESAHLNPRVLWYEGQPKLIPLVEAKVKIQDEWYLAGVRRMDSQGLFVFFKDLSVAKALTKEISPKQAYDFELTFRGHRVEGEGWVRSLFLGGNFGIGLQFLPKDLYHFSQYTALVESLKGEGHA